jgi:hypothetical protein
MESSSNITCRAKFLARNIDLPGLASLISVPMLLVFPWPARLYCIYPPMDIAEVGLEARECKTDSSTSLPSSGGSIAALYTSEDREERYWWLGYR